MVNKCIYCSCEIELDSPIDICQKCMYQVWGKKMSEAIISNMRKNQENGNILFSEKFGEKENIKPKEEQLSFIEDKNLECGESSEDFVKQPDESIIAEFNPETSIFFK